MKSLLRLCGRGIYLAAAWLSAQALGWSGQVSNVSVHRSVATGEVRFGRSDIDLLMVLRPEAWSGRSLAALYRRLRLLRRFNPALLHVELYPPQGIEQFALSDSVWASMERQSLRCLWGQSLEVPDLPVQPEHALRRLLLWWEVMLCPALHQRDNSYNIEKIALECWNFFSLAEGLQTRPAVLRSEIRQRAARFGAMPDTGLGRAELALSFFLKLVARMHSARLPPLGRLREPYRFSAITAPHGTLSTFLVVPGPDGPFPPCWQGSGALVATPELLDLLQHRKNAFMSWSLPSELRDLGLSQPTLESFRRDAHYICAGQFVLFPGFVERASPLNPEIRIRLVRHALESLRRGCPPEPVSQQQLSAMVRRIDDIETYYLEDYPALETERRELRQSLSDLRLPCAGEPEAHP